MQQAAKPIEIVEALGLLRKLAGDRLDRSGGLNVQSTDDGDDHIDTILFVGDPHFKKDNVSQTEKYAEETIRVFEACPRGTVCLLAGDVLDSHGVLHLNPLRRATTFLQHLLKIGRVIVLVGNHDMINNQEYLSDYNWMSAVLEPWARLDKRLTVVNTPIMIDGLVFAPYVPVGRFLEALDTTLSRERWSTSRCVFGHQEIRGCYDNSVCSVRHSRHMDGDDWKSEYPPLVSGHIHTPTFVGTNVVYPGSVISHSFGESGQSAVHLIVPPSSTCRAATEKYGSRFPIIIPIRISVPRRRTTVVQMEQIISDEVAAYANIKPSDELERVRVRIVLPSPSSAADPRLKRFVKNAPHNVKINLVVDETYQLRRAEAARDPSGVTGITKRYQSFEENLMDAAKSQGSDVYEYIVQNLGQE